MPPPPAPPELFSLSHQELTELVQKLGEPSFRARQLADAIFRQRRESLDDVSNLPASLKIRLAEDGLRIGLPKIEAKFQSVDGTVRYLMAFADGQSVETVWMPEGDFGEAGDGSEAGMEEEDGYRPSASGFQPDHSVAGIDSDNNPDHGDPKFAHTKHEPAAGSRKPIAARRSRATICVSSQVGCAVACQFCMTALLGVKRNLSAGEIVGQISAVLEDQKVSPPHDRINLVFMGMGEPFLNYDNFIKASRLLVEGVGIPETRMTVSTAGIVPRIYDFGQEEIRPKLAISLNASNDEARDRLMPINRKWNLEKLMGAAREFPLRNREKLTFEYVLLSEVNDAPQNAREVVDL